ncbi:hypothetical protein PIB30_067043 [Stylosanthes scabra]|uniref:Uncharacterized protein n=1 Tax=Stylosanthes scabra TaxID=79078 RepID=A0ABU6SNI3_9FABA|nr:hypothetical protein [Stylosanthes scabra]
MNTIIIFIIFCFCLCIQTHHASSSSSYSISSSESKNIFPKEAHPTKSGYLPVSNNSSSAIFYAFYEAQNSTLPLSKTPLLIWLEGGPGTSSLIGNFYEVGPWRITESITLEPNPGSWNNYFGLLFLDNPIGTGFSIASSRQEIPTDQQGIARHLFAAITSFLQLDPVYKHRPIYINGQSYGGKFGSTTGYYIMKRNAQLRAPQRVNLAGVVIGDGSIELKTQLGTIPANAYYLGLINEKQKNELEKDLLEVVRFTETLQWGKATDAAGRLRAVLQNMTGLATLDDYTRKDHPYHYEDWVTKFLNIAEVDQYDLLAGPVQIEACVKLFKWEGIEDYLNAERKIWKVNGELAGYVQQWKSLTNVVVLGGGHLMPADQPLNAKAMIEDWVLQRGLYQSV